MKDRNVNERARVLIVTHIRHLWSREVTGSVKAIRAMGDYLSKYHDVEYYCTKWIRNVPPEGVGLFCGQGVLGYSLERLKYFLARLLRKAEKGRALLLSNADPEAQQEMRSFLEHLDHHDYDVVIFEYLHNHHLLEAVDRQAVKCAMDTHDLMHLRTETYEAKGRVNPLKISREQELFCLGQYDKVLAIQDQEYEILSECFKEKVVLVKRPAELCPLPFGRSLDNKLVLCFVASLADHNIDALTWFLREVWTKEVEAVSTLNIYGRICEANYVRSLSSDGVYLKGAVESIADAYRDSQLIINPVRVGSGLKIKNVEALGYGRGVLTTTLGAQGMESCLGRSILVADTAESMKKTILELSGNWRRLESLCHAAVTDAERYFSHDECFAELNKWLKNVARGASVISEATV